MDTEIGRDPDYEEIHINQQNHLSAIKNDVKDATIKRIQTIINKEFNKEIEMKENELVLIEKNLQEAHYVLDQLRTSIITKFYLGEKINQNNSIANPSEQSWIHPTIKQYLGKAPTGTYIPSSAIREHDYSTPLKISSTDPEKSKEAPGNETNDKVEASAPNLQRVKKTIKIVVGNISKFIPPVEQSHNDQTTHKWMVYFRLKNEKLDIKSIVRKVIIFLHPSYKPNDLVEIREPPFYLCRRGWGEFPLRIQVHFRDPQNKPFDIIHNLKLDKTFTGLQTMGGETVEDVSLYLNESVSTATSKSRDTLNVNSTSVPASKKPTNTTIINGTIKVEPAESSTYSSNSLEETVDEDETKKPSIPPNSNFVFQKETYIEDVETKDSPLSTKKLKSLLKPKATSQPVAVSLLKKNVQQEYRVVVVQPNASATEVKYFLCPSNSTPVLSKPVSLLTKNSVPNVKIKKEPADSTSFSGCSLWQNNEQRHKSLVLQQFLLTLENYDSMQEFMVDLVKYFPLCSENPVYPYCTSSYEKFNSWNIGKQRASEWLRAKTISRILQDLLKNTTLPWAKEIWKPKTILLWCRASGFIPPFYMPVIANSKIIRKCRKDKEATIVNAVNIVMELEEKKQCCVSREIDAVEENIDVEIVEDKCAKNYHLKRNHVESDYIKELFLSKPVEEPDTIKEIYSTICKEFISDVIHCALFEGAKSQRSKLTPNQVSIDNVYKAILNNSKFDILTNKYLGMDYEND